MSPFWAATVAIGKDRAVGAVFDRADCDCERCRKKKIAPTARMITIATTTHPLRRRLLPAGPRARGLESPFADSTGGTESAVVSILHSVVWSSVIKALSRHVSQFIS